MYTLYRRFSKWITKNKTTKVRWVYWIGSCSQYY